MGHKLRMPALIKQQHVLIECAFRLAMDGGVFPESDVGNAAQQHDLAVIARIDVSTISADFRKREMAGGICHQRLGKSGVMAPPTAHFSEGDDVGLDSAHDMQLDPFTAVSELPFMPVEP